MYNILQNSWRLFTRNKEYLSSIVIAPVLMLLLFSFLLSFQSHINIGVVNQDTGDFGKMIEETIGDMEFVKPRFVKIRDAEHDIMNNKIALAVIIGHQVSSPDTGNTKPIRIISSQDSGLADYIEAILNTRINNYYSDDTSPFSISQNEVPEKGVPIANALGIIIFKMLASGSLLAGIIIMEKKSGIKDRIYMSKTRLSTYLAGHGIVFFGHLLLFTAIYFITARLFHFDFAMKNPERILLVFLVLGIFTTSYGLLLSAFARDDNAVWSFGVMIALPASILSGALFPFDAMPKILQTIGSLFPQRWITAAIETLQNGGTLHNAFLPLSAVLILSAVFFIIASIQLKKGN